MTKISKNYKSPKSIKSSIFIKYIRIKTSVINSDLARRQVGYGRGDRMKIEKDTVEIKSGIRLGRTTGAPICLEIKNKDYIVKYTKNKELLE